ncbi:hypothetical protein ACFOZ7_14385 [Natribaculum luteum]|uniref:Uncharacterized protein n=1 Tax=Natribaculum luteum TaxID=1586232 RepID=A0ABD5P1C5_9EURY|nr:hypothetical protein [Natribaculum luteum]
MADPSAALGPLSKLVDGASDYYEFWKDYKGEEILIRTHSVAVGGDSGDRGNIRQNSYVIRGTVSDVTSFPPGFLLEDVEEYVELSDARLMWGAGPEPIDAVEGNRGKQTLREIDEKYVSFNAIEELERAEAADSATEPFREDEEGD